MNGIGDFVTSIKESRNLVAQVVAEFKGEAAGHPFRGNQYGDGQGGGNRGKSEDFSKAMGESELMSPDNIEPVNEITDREKYNRISESMKKDGWQGPPILAFDSANGTQAITGSHRIWAAREAGIDIPVDKIDFSSHNLSDTDIEDIGNFADIAGTGDDRVLDFMDSHKFVKRGLITKNQYNIMKHEVYKKS